MLIKISVSQFNVVESGDGYIIAKVKFSGGNLASAGYICTVNGETAEDFNTNDAKYGKSIMIGTRGGISLA